MFKIDIPTGAKQLIAFLKSGGHASYVVGGCVRDFFLGKEARDWDICTSATPDEVCKLMDTLDISVYKTGIQHGTVTVSWWGDRFEVTTFRVDGEYDDNRRPSRVEFVCDVVEDLSRRDFTINAMAYSDADGLIDPWGGYGDLDAKLIRCVRNPDDRFREDALRIMRALRFASTLGFTIEEKTAAAIHRNKHLLKNISAERIRDELCKLLLGGNVLDILLEYSDVMAVIIPELEPCIGFEQNNPYHKYTVYEHAAWAVNNYLGNDIAIKLALLLHDIDKPECYTEDLSGVGHFYGHSAASERITEGVLKRLRFDNKTVDEVCALVLYHDADIKPAFTPVRRWLSKVGYQAMEKLVTIRLVDISAQKTDNTPGTDQRIADCFTVAEMMKIVSWENACLRIRDLAVNGSDIMRECGIESGPIVGKVLNHLLDKVLDGEIENGTEELIEEAVEYLRKEA